MITLKNRMLPNGKQLLTGVIILLFLILNFLIVPRVRDAAFFRSLHEDPSTEAVSLSDAEKVRLQQRVENLQKRIERRATPGNSYLIINTSENTFRLYKRKELIRTGLCSTGSFIHLVVDSTRHWVFETPKGVLTVRNKITNPVWRKPDWAFLEEGKVPPPPDHASRFEPGALGDYALDLGDGYLIHGTLYQRFLGQSVTHGCIRLNDEDLKAVYQTLPIGSKIYIY